MATGAHPADPLGRILALVLDAVTSPATRRQYGYALTEFASWRARARLPFARATLHSWRMALQQKGLSASTVNQYLAAVRKLAKEAAAHGLIDEAQAAGIRAVENVKQRGTRMGHWLTQTQAQKLLEAPEPKTLKGKRDLAALSLLVGCGLRRSEAAGLNFEQIQMREERWVIPDLRGKHGRIRTVPVPAWVKTAVDRWAKAAQLTTGRILRSMNRHDHITGETLSGQAVLDLAAKYGAEIGVTLKAHDLRRTCAKLCRKHGGELEQIQLLLGHASIETTERYLGTKQDLHHAPNDRIRLRLRDEVEDEGGKR